MGAGFSRPHLIERNLQHDGKGQVAVKEGHTVGEAEAFSRPRRGSQQQPVDSSVWVPGGVQAHLPVGPGGNLHLPHSEPCLSARRTPTSVASQPRQASCASTLRSKLPLTPALNTIQNSVQKLPEEPSPASFKHSWAGALALRPAPDRPHISPASIVLSDRTRRSKFVQSRILKFVLACLGVKRTEKNASGKSLLAKLPGLYFGFCFVLRREDKVSA